jgi:signal transduction histidine kinase
VLGSIAVSDSDPASTIKAYANLLSLAVHEFRGPVAVVSGYLRMLQNLQPLDDRQRKMVDEAAKSTARIVDLIAEMSDIAKLDSGEAVVRSERFDLFSVVGEVAATVHEAQDRGVVLQVQGESAGARLTGDLKRVRTAIAGFLRAILREQPPDSVIAVDCRTVREGAITSAVVVIARKDAVQQSYETARGPLDEERGGLGFLLPIGRRVIERCGGHVWSPLGDETLSAYENAKTRRSAIVISVPLVELSR